jgi:hypothetical protein
MYNRRANERFEANASATLAFSRNNEETFILQNISTRGAGIVGYHPLQVNDKVRIAFQMPQFFDKPIRKVAKIAWCKKVNNSLWEGGLDFGLDNLLALQ